MSGTVGFCMCPTGIFGFLLFAVFCHHVQQEQASGFWPVPSSVACSTCRIRAVSTRRSRLKDDGRHGPHRKNGYGCTVKKGTFPRRQDKTIFSHKKSRMFPARFQPSLFSRCDFPKKLTVFRFHGLRSTQTGCINSITFSYPSP